MRATPCITVRTELCWHIPTIHWMHCRIECGHYTRRSDAIRGAVRALRRIGYKGEYEISII